MCNELNERNELKDLIIVCKTVKSIFCFNRNHSQCKLNYFVVPRESFS